MKKGLFLDGFSLTLKLRNPVVCAKPLRSGFTRFYHHCSLEYRVYRGSGVSFSLSILHSDLLCKAIQTL